MHLNGSFPYPVYNFSTSAIEKYTWNYIHKIFKIIYTLLYLISDNHSTFMREKFEKNFIYYKFRANVFAHSYEKYEETFYTSKLK